MMLWCTLHGDHWNCLPLPPIYFDCLLHCLWVTQAFDCLSCLSSKTVFSLNISNCDEKEGESTKLDHAGCHWRNSILFLPNNYVDSNLLKLSVDCITGDLNQVVCSHLCSSKYVMCVAELNHHCLLSLILLSSLCSCPWLTLFIHTCLFNWISTDIYFFWHGNVEKQSTSISAACPTVHHSNLE